MKPPVLSESKPKAPDELSIRCVMNADWRSRGSSLGGFRVSALLERERVYSGIYFPGSRPE